MPPVRWKRWIYVTAVLVQAAGFFPAADAQQLQDSISMSSDGWRPIVGSGRQSSVTQNRDFEVAQVDVLEVETTTAPLPQSSLSLKKILAKNSVSYSKGVKTGIKLKHQTTNPYYTLTPSGSHHGSPIPIGANQQLKKLQVVKKPTLVYGKPRKPVRGQALAHSSRNEVFVAPPPNTVSYSYVKSLTPNNIRTREAQGFGLVGGSNFGQSNAHIELARFPLVGESILQRPTFFLAKPAQNNEYSGNFPGQRGRIQQQNKDSNHKISLYAFKDPAADATSSFSQFGGRPNQYASQLTHSYDLSNSQQNQQQKSNKAKEQAVDVQVTKENLQQFSQNDPGRLVNTAAGSLSQKTLGSFGGHHGVNHFPIQYVDYDFTGKLRPPTPSSPLTYEVTESKFLDTPSQQFQFRPHDSFVPPRSQQLQTNARPGFLFSSDLSTPQPPFFQAPLVDLSVPAFLPTPYKPDNGVIPTSPTQSEVSTIFNQVSSKRNKLRNNAAQQNNPLVFDITEVSTHFPILGSPEAQSEGAPGTTQLINENSEISNEITTQRERHKERTRRPTKEPTRPTSTRDPTKSRITNRRRPRPRKPSTTTTTTTEVPVIDNYEPERSRERFEEQASVETEKPRRKRPKPQLYRPRETVGDEGERLAENRRPVEEDTSRNRRPVEEEPLSKQRGRYRFRTRERPSTERSDTGPIVRKRLRPSYSENLLKEQQRLSFDETTEASVEHEQYSYEADPTVYSSYSDESSQSEQHSGLKEVNTQSQQPNNYFQTTQEEVIKPFIEEIHPGTEKDEMLELTKIPSTSTTTAEATTLFHIPENEIDYTTQAHQLLREEPKEEPIASTPQTSTTTTEVTTTKTGRVRIRPSKYDSSNRPRFSVKDYRQRLNQYTSSTPSPTTVSQPIKNSADNLRLRFPGRLRSRPTQTTASNRADEDNTEESTTTKSRFSPKDPRFQTTTDSNLIITEKNVVAVNTRLRPFGRSRMPTEATTVAPKISIRPNLFSARRRTGYPSLKNRIQNKYKKNATEIEEEKDEATTLQNELQEIESLKITETVSTEFSSSTTDSSVDESANDNISTELNLQTTTEDIMKNDAQIYSQRVSDLTSSFKDYDKPGVFNSVSPTSRSIPNYFTISTDDPILPIEAFFPGLKEKEKSNKRR